MRRNGRPKGRFWRVRFFSLPLRFALKTPENLKGAEKKRTLQKHPFGRPFLRTTPSPLLWRTPISQFNERPRATQSGPTQKRTQASVCSLSSLSPMKQLFGRQRLLPKHECQGPLNGGVSNGGVSRSGRVLPFLSFFVLLGLSRGFSRFARGWSGDFPDSFLFSFSAY